MSIPPSSPSLWATSAATPTSSPAPSVAELSYAASLRSLAGSLHRLLADTAVSSPALPLSSLPLNASRGVNASMTNWDAEGTSCSLVLEDNPLVDFVELPNTCQCLYYCNILSRVIRGALEMVSMKTEVTRVRDMLHGDDAYELRVKLLKQVPEEYPYKDDDPSNH